MCWIEVDLEPADAMVEGAVNEVGHRVVDGDRHRQRDQDRQDDDTFHNSAVQLQMIGEKPNWLKSNFWLLQLLIFPANTTKLMFHSRS